MLDLTNFYTHELERLWLSPATPAPEKEALERELHLRDTDPSRGPVVDTQKDTDVVTTEGGGEKDV